MIKLKSVSIISALITASLLTNCRKDPLSTTSAIVGVSEGGGLGALGLVPLRNRVNPALLSESAGSPGLRQAQSIASTYFLALTECKNTSSASAENLMMLLEDLASKDQLFLNAQRQLVTNSTSADVAKLGTKSGQDFVIPCQLVGPRLVSWDVIARIQKQMTALPEAAPTSPDQIVQAKRKFLSAQMFHLAMRGTYSADPNKDNMSKLGHVMMMAADQRVIDITNINLEDNLRASDAIYNPCVKRDGSNPRLSYTDSWKSANFSCVNVAGTSDLFNYRPGGDSKTPGQSDVKECNWPAKEHLNYIDVSRLLACEISSSHTVLFKNQNTAIQQLWDIVTSTAPWQSWSKPGVEIAKALAGGSFDFAKTFGTAPTGIALTTTNYPYYDYSSYYGDMSYFGYPAQMYGVGANSTTARPTTTRTTVPTNTRTNATNSTKKAGGPAPDVYYPYDMEMSDYSGVTYYGGDMYYGY